MDNPAGQLSVSSPIRLAVEGEARFIRAMEEVFFAHPDFVVVQAKAASDLVLMRENASGESGDMARLYVLLGEPPEEAGAPLRTKETAVTLPIRFAELAALLRAKLAHAFGHGVEAGLADLAIGALTLSPRARALVFPDGTRTQLTEKEVAMLAFLARSGPEPVSKEVLLAQVWGYKEGVNTHTLETHIYRLRQKLDAPPTPSPLLPFPFPSPLPPFPSPLPPGKVAQTTSPTQDPAKAAVVLVTEAGGYRLSLR